MTKLPYGLTLYDLGGALDILDVDGIDFENYPEGKLLEAFEFIVKKANLKLLKTDNLEVLNKKIIYFIGEGPNTLLNVYDFERGKYCGYKHILSMIEDLQKGNEDG